MSEIKIPSDPGSAGWDSILPPRPVNSELRGSQCCDFLIIGAGFAGLSAAQRLNQVCPEAKIIILEGGRVAQGAAGRNSGFMIDLPHDLSSNDYAGSIINDQRQINMNRAAIRFARQSAEAYEMSDEALNPCGKTNAAATVEGMQHKADYASHLQELNEPYKLLDSVEMKSLTGINYYMGGLWTPGTCILQPALYTRKLAEGLQNLNSIDLFELSPVTRLKRTASRWHASTPNGLVTTDKVILAVNGLVQQFGYYQRRLMHVYLYASMSRCLTSSECKKLGGEPQWAMTPADPMGSTVRKIRSDSGYRILVRNRFSYDPGLKISNRRIKSVSVSHMHAFHVRFPMLPEMKMQYTWGGRLCLSLNKVSALGEVDEGLFSACCQNGLGAAKGTVSGIIAAEQAVGIKKSLIEDYQPEPLPKKLFPEPFMYIGANAYMRWKEWRAGREF